MMMMTTSTTATTTMMMMVNYDNKVAIVAAFVVVVVVVVVVVFVVRKRVSFAVGICTQLYVYFSRLPKYPIHGFSIDSAPSMTVTKRVGDTNCLPHLPIYACVIKYFGCKNEGLREQWNVNVIIRKT